MSTGPGAGGSALRGRTRRSARPLLALAATLVATALGTAACTATSGAPVPAPGTTGTDPATLGASATRPPSATAPVPATTAPPPLTTVAPTAPPTTLPRSLRHEVTTTTAAPARGWAPCPEPAGRWVRTSVPSHVITQMPTQPLLVYEPPCYDRDVDRAYPVLYLFHGAQTDETQWQDVGIGTAADHLITTGQIPPLLIVLPDIIWGMGTYEGAAPLFDRVLLDELMPVVEAQWRTIPDRRHRAVGGISRGGEWAFLVAGRHPEEFGSVGGHSPAVGPPSTPNSVLVPLVAAARPRIHLDVGQSDSLAGVVGSFSAALAAAGVPADVTTGPGGHDRAYWGAHTEEYLRFYSAAWPDAMGVGAPAPPAAAPGG